jgi:hypothetical protein
MSILIDLVKEIWLVFNTASTFIILGLIFSGAMQIFVEKEKIVRHLGGSNIKSVLWASILGIPLPLCSCGVIPTAVALKKKGASKAAVASFLISTPETGIDSIFLSYALLNPLMAVYRPLAALFTAIVSGILENIFGKKEPVSKEEQKSCVFCEGKDSAHSHRLSEKLKHGMNFAFVDLLADISKWLLIGIASGGIISYFMPESLIQNYFSSNYSMFLMLLIGIPLYICASGSTPIAAALIAKGMSPGAAMVFLLAGPATNITTILTMIKFMGKRSTALYLTSISVCSLLSGYILNKIYQLSKIDIRSTIGQVEHILPHYFKTACSVMLLLLILNAFSREKKC